MSEPYQVGITARAARDLQRLPDKIATACVEFIFGPLAANPHRVGKPLRAELEGSHLARRGDYRVVYAIRAATHLVEVEHIDRRSDVYRCGRGRPSSARGGSSGAGEGAERVHSGAGRG